jgi:hypothetical protein
MMMAAMHATPPGLLIARLWTSKMSTALSEQAVATMLTSIDLAAPRRG